MTEVGTLSHGAGGVLLIQVDAERYRIDENDIKSLLFYGRVVPILQERTASRANGLLVSEIAIEGHAAINRSGKAVVLHHRRAYMPGPCCLDVLPKLHRPVQRCCH